MYFSSAGSDDSQGKPSNLLSDGRNKGRTTKERTDQRLDGRKDVCINDGHKEQRTEMAKGREYKRTERLKDVKTKRRKDQ